MKGKIVSVLLICLVGLSITFSCSSMVMSSPALQSSSAVQSKSNTITEEPRQITKLSCPELNLKPMGDSIDDPTPHSHKH